MPHYFVRYGLISNVGLFSTVDALQYPRRSRVILRTGRGLEIGEVLSHADRKTTPEQLDGQILRPMGVEDDLLEARLQKHRNEAFEACTSLLEENNVQATLMDVEHLFDGQGLYFYFLGDPPHEAEAITKQLANTYETSVEFKRFAETLEEGCGPGCGTEAAMGQGGCADCTSCAVAAACKK